MNANNGSVNVAAFELLLNGAFDIKIQRGGTTSKLQCRDLPFTTVMHVINQLIVSSHAEIVNARRRLASELESMVGQEDDWQQALFTSLTSPGGFSRILSVVMPIIVGVANSAPDIVERILEDIVIGADSRPEVARSLSATEGMTIINEAMKRIDKDALRKQVEEVFFAVTSLFPAPKEEPQTEETLLTEQPVSTGTAPEPERHLI